MSDRDIQKGYDLGYADGLAHGKLEGADETEQRIARLLLEAGFTVALELREGDPAIWDDKNKKWIELTEKAQR